MCVRASAALLFGNAINHTFHIRYIINISWDNGATSTMAAMGSGSACASVRVCVFVYFEICGRWPRVAHRVSDTHVPK